MIPLQTTLQTLQNQPTQAAEDPPAPEWKTTLQELRIGLHAAFGQAFNHLNDPQILSYWYRQFKSHHLTPEDVLTTLRQITHRESKAPTLADFLSVARHTQEGRRWRTQQQEKQRTQDRKNQHE